MVLHVLIGFVIGGVVGFFVSNHLHQTVAAVAGNSGKVPPGQEKKP